MTTESDTHQQEYEAKFNRAELCAVAIAAESVAQGRFPESREILNRIQEADPTGWEFGFGPRNAAKLLTAYADAYEAEEWKKATP